MHRSFLFLQRPFRPSRPGMWLLLILLLWNVPLNGEPTTGTAVLSKAKPPDTDVRLVLMGPPGAGKSTAGKGLHERFGIPHISVGDLCRTEAKSGSEIGRQLATIMAKGELATDSLIFDLLFQRLEREDCGNGFILDGFPRTIAQAHKLASHLQAKGIALTAVVDIRVSPEVLTRRLQDRKRADDTPEAIRKRFEVYRAEAGPIEEFYRSAGLLRQIDGDQATPEGTLRQILDQLCPASSPTSLPAR